MSIQTGIDRLEAKGIKLEVSGDNIAYTPKHLLTRPMALWLTANKPAVIELLHKQNAPCLTVGDMVKIPASQLHDSATCKVLSIFDDGKSVVVEMPKREDLPKQALFPTWVLVKSY